MDKIRVFILLNKKVVFSLFYILTLVYVNNGLPFKLKRVVINGITYNLLD